MSHPPRRMLGAVITATLLAGLTQIPVIAAPGAPTATAAPKVLEDADAGLDDLDTRGRLLPTAAQKTSAASLGGLVRWNRFGTPASISKPTGNLGRTSSSNAETAARSWLSSHAGLFGMSRGPDGPSRAWSAASPSPAAAPARCCSARTSVVRPRPSTAW